MTQGEVAPEFVSESGDFNIFVGAASGLLKGVNLNPNSNLCKNFTSNLKALDRSQHVITCMTWVPDTSQNEILIGLRNGTYRHFNCTDKKFQNNLKSTEEYSTALGPLVGIAHYETVVLTAFESGKNYFSV